MTALLSVRGVHTYYGRVQALKGVDIEVNERLSIRSRQRETA